jgi:8-amino-7-oxononanoate synthase
MHSRVSSWEAWFAQQRAARESAGVQRVLRSPAAAEDVIDLANNDYLGLSCHPTYDS